MAVRPARQRHGLLCGAGAPGNPGLLRMAKGVTMARASFLDKLTGGWQRQGPAGDLEQVRRNLEAVLNTKEGYGYFVEGYGLGRYTAKFGTKELMKTLVGEMLHAIGAHESRLRDAELELRGRDSALW